MPDSGMGGKAGMGFRFRKSFKAGPFRINLSKSGVGYSVGSKYFRVTKKANGGVRTTSTIPGTGFSHVKDYSAKQVRTTQESSAVKSSGGTKFPAWVIAAILLVCVFAGIGSDKDKASTPPSQTSREENEEPVDYSSVSACFADVFPDAEISCIESGSSPQVTVKTELSSEDQPENWAQLLDSFETCLESADGAAKALSRKTALGQIVAADGTILASGYNGKLQFDLFAKRAADQAEADRIAAEKASQSTSSSLNSRTVYVTPSGSKYHYSSSCNGGSYSATTLDDALSRGLTACKKCA